MFYQIFFLQQVKRCTIISNKHGIYEEPHGVAQRPETWEDLRK